MAEPSRAPYAPEPRPVLTDIHRAVTMAPVRTKAAMTQTEALLRQAYRSSGLGLLGISFAQAMDIRAIRIALTLRVSDWQHGRRAPTQPALI